MFHLSPLVVSPEILVAKGGTMWARNGRWILPEMTDFHVAHRNLLHAVNLRHGTDGFTPPHQGRRAEDFFALKNPTASAANLGTKGQHATCRLPKPLSWLLLLLLLLLLCSWIIALLLCHFKNWIFVRRYLSHVITFWGEEFVEMKPKSRLSELN